MERSKREVKLRRHVKRSAIPGRLKIRTGIRWVTCPVCGRRMKTTTRRRHLRLLHGAR